MDRECVVLLCKHLSKSLQSLNLSGCRTTLLDSGIDFLGYFMFISLKFKS
jgi:hypothetical protein